MAARLIIVSNRVVAPEDADSSLADEMAATVKAALKNQNGMWFGWSGKVTGEPASEPRILEVNKLTYVQIELSSNDIQEYCNGLANSVLWPILHYRVDLQEYSRADASGYMRVNHLFAGHLSALMNEDDIVWVHDYHLMLLSANCARAAIATGLAFSYTRLARRPTFYRPCHTTGRSLGG